MMRMLAFKLPAPQRLRRLAVLLLLGAVALALWLPGWRVDRAMPQAGRLAVIVPDASDGDDVRIAAWRDAAAETGFLLELVTASQLMRDAERARDAALILPDGLMRQMNDALLAEITRRVQAGTRLMLVHDAGVVDLTGNYHPRQSRLSQLAGLRYALFGELGTAMLQEQEVHLDAQSMPLLRLPPGRVVRGDSDRPLTSGQPPLQAGEVLAVTSYFYGRPRYATFTTAGPYDGQRLLHAADGTLLAGVRAMGRGRVLFVNLPLTYLKLRTDSLLLHSFLRYFAQDLAELPQLSPMPDARGALIMNWHIDSAAAVPAMEKLQGLGAFDQGPYSVHLTVGPDVDVPGDGQGMDLARNPVMQAWVRRFIERGDEVGSHGGWIHNEFGRLIGTQAPALSAAMIDRNIEVIRQVSGRPVTEYSAPTGNHPAWVTPWLRERGIKAYYFAGDGGMAPTRTYQDGRRGAADSWAFPVLSFGRDAAFEEAHAKQTLEADLAAWLTDLSDYCATNRTVRLVYFHPPGIALFPLAFRDWLTHSRELALNGRLRWTTMTQHADFSNLRLQVQWQLLPRSGGQALSASHPLSLKQMSWLLPTQRFREPRVSEGRAEVVREGEFWRVTAEDVPRLELLLEPALEALPEGTAAALSTPRSPAFRTLR